MQNPFTSTLLSGVSQPGPDPSVASIPTGQFAWPGIYDFPGGADNLELHHTMQSVFPGHDPQSFYFGPNYPDDSNVQPDRSVFPDYVGNAPVNVRPYRNPDILAPTTSLDHSSIMAGPGAVDQLVPRDVGSVPGKNWVLQQSGPVAGNGTGYTGYIQKLRPIQAGQSGPVSGGPDYGNQLAASNYASQQAALYSQQALNNAMAAAI